MYADAGVQRHDSAHLVNDRVTTELPSLARQVVRSAAEDACNSASAETVTGNQAQVLPRNLANTCCRGVTICVGHALTLSASQRGRRCWCTATLLFCSMPQARALLHGGGMQGALMVLQNSGLLREPTQTGLLMFPAVPAVRSPPCDAGRGRVTRHWRCAGGDG